MTDKPLNLWKHIDKDGWRVEFRVESEDGLPIVAEIQIRPLDESARPARGITSNVLRSIRVDRDLLGELHRAMRDAAEQRPTFGYDVKTQRFTSDQIAMEDPFHPDHGDFAGFDRSTPKRGRKHKPAIFYARIARTYVDALADGRSVVEEVSDQHTESGSFAAARDLIERTRKYGFLTPTVQGKKGGELTTLARKTLNDERKSKARKRKGKGER